jgi:sugar (pentulose or hexulose) kinase
LKCWLGTAARLAERWVRREAVCEPNPQRHAFHEDQFQRYRRLYQAIRNGNLASRVP